MSPVLSPRSAPATASCFPRHALPRRHSVLHRSAPSGHHPRLGRTILCHHDGGTLWIIICSGRTAGSNPACAHAPRGLLHDLHHYNHPQVRTSSAISLAIASCTHDSGLALLTSPMVILTMCDGLILLSHRLQDYGYAAAAAAFKKTKIQEWPLYGVSGSCSLAELECVTCLCKVKFRSQASES